MKNYSFLFLAISLFSISCHKEHFPTQSFPVTYTYSREFYLKQANSHLVAHYQSLDSITIIGIHNKDGISIKMNIKPEKEGVCFEVAHHNIHPEFIGTYPINGISNQTGVASISYNYANSTIFTIYPGELFQTRGNFTISKYDSINKIFSGSFQVTYTNVSNPLLSATESTANPNDLADIMISGEFANVKLVN